MHFLEKLLALAKAQGITVKEYDKLVFKADIIMKASGDFPAAIDFFKGGATSFEKRWNLKSTLKRSVRSFNVMFETMNSRKRLNLAKLCLPKE